jgi:imidazolonepropionase-like amidohydrolase
MQNIIMKLLPLILFLTSLVHLSLAQDSYVIHCGELFDSKSATISSEQSIVIAGNKITEVVAGFIDVDDDQILLDYSDALVMPGLVDLHVHLEIQSNKNSYINKFRQEKELLTLQAYSYGMKTLQAGFTTVRDLGGSGGNMALRDAVDRGIVKGPRVYTCRKSLAITGGHADASNGMKTELQGEPNYQDGVCDGAEECAKAVRWQVKQGADCIKITATGGVLSVARDGDGPAFNDEELKAIVETASDRGVHVAAHAHGKDGMLRAVKAGVKTIEHGTYMDDEVMDEMKKRGTYYVPTITAGWAVAKNAEIDDYYPDVVRPKARRIGPQIQETFAKAYKAGVKIAFGTDAGVFDHGMNAKEFELMVEAGMPMKQALKSATWTAAEVLGWQDKIGSIEKGKMADIVAFSKTVMQDPTKMMEVIFVMKNGDVIVSRE